MVITYEDSQVICYEDRIEIKRYYFPLGTNKIIKYSDIRTACQKNMNILNGRGRIWGMNFNPYWFNLDNNRPFKNTVFILDIGQLIKPAITPDSPEKFYEEIKNKVKLI